ncbi:MAG: helix-turn-helix domain-containing protein [Gammaproteobacteria bacterium]|nr:helix-turn-helix domain-containing protein [Gammaproteobacteria bacterium]
MIQVSSPQLQELARRMGEHLREGRRRRFPRDTQDDFARRIGVSRYTYHKMERGDPSVALRSYLAAAVQLGIERQFADGLSPPTRPFFDDA